MSMLKELKRYGLKALDKIDDAYDGIHKRIRRNSKIDLKEVHRTVEELYQAIEMVKVGVEERLVEPDELYGKDIFSYSVLSLSTVETLLSLLAAKLENRGYVKEAVEELENLGIELLGHAFLLNEVSDKPWEVMQNSLRKASQGKIDEEMMNIVLAYWRNRDRTAVGLPQFFDDLRERVKSALNKYEECRIEYNLSN